ncbi:ankyrin repeat domain-containing protein [Deinococcus humi]|uniref:Ankyrin repeat protein n=1 Tax=Deinococcus humi TaxID=662880 RepID=A0A7W8K2L5_9DEIO|nr:ankyrin repeat domain-containing protein [Deinococcus humi]MBB5366144.1 ankyrin repeat protein [Deinococcus humi]GGO40283.1 hypothetical protein GCM10008949_49620 [Deinococcus humi]
MDIGTAIDNDRIDEIDKALSNHSLSEAEKSFGLSEAITQHKFNIAKLFLLHGANPNIETDEPRSYPAILRASEGTNVDMMKAILGHGGDPNCVFFGGGTPLITALETISLSEGKNNLEMIEVLLDAGAYIHYRWIEAGGITPIDLADTMESKVVRDYLISYKESAIG